jgi:hypothetical protein
MKTLTIILSSFLILSNLVYSQDFYNRSNIQTIELFFGISNWDAQLDVLTASDQYLLADSVRINGIVFDSVGVKYKGNSSYNANNNKNPLHIELNYIHGSYDYQGHTDIKLQNGFQDPSMIREVLSYAILEQYMDCPKSNFANVYINGNLRGLYSNTEEIDEKFNGDHYYSTNGAHFKCNPIGGAGPGGGGNPDLNYINSDSSSYYSSYELKSTHGWKELIDFIDALNHQFESIESVLDIDRAIWMLAYNNVLVNLDSYSGAFRQNYYLYNDLNARFVPTIWDLNMSFGGFPGGTGSGAFTATSLDPFSNSTSSLHPLIVKIMANPMYKRMYMAHLRTIVKETFESNVYLTMANQLRSSIDASVQADPYKFYTYTQFQNSLTTAISSGGPGPGGSTPGIQALMDARVSFFNSNANYQLVAPTITLINVNNNVQPTFGQAFTITATCTNESTVYIGYRTDHRLKFNRVQLVDDGQHGDGAAGDHVYGASLLMDNTHMEYYIYAENENAGVFSPQRAEHEFHVIDVASSNPLIGNVVVNELLADNSAIAYDANGQSNDWIELYNKTTNAINLSGLYLSDDALTLTKWQFKQGTIIAPHGFLIVWADNDTLQYGLHANFKLSINGESVILSNGTSIFNQVDFAAQTTDISYARCPDGGVFTYTTPTFNASNDCKNGLNEATAEDFISVFPNPSMENVFIANAQELELTIHVYDMTGRLMYKTERVKSNSIDIPSKTWNKGHYQFVIQSGQEVIVKQFFKL